MTEKYPYSVHREIKTYAFLYHAAVDALEKARNIEEGGFYQIMSSIVFSAFTLEAYLNHIGEIKIEYWEEIEKITPTQKLKVMYSHLNIPYNSSMRPIQTVKQVFKFRNFMAHGKTEKIQGTGTLKQPKPNPGENLIDTEWEKFCNIKEAERAVNDVKEIIESLCEKAGLQKFPLYSLGSGSYTIG